jgi:hypothetical protein
MTSRGSGRRRASALLGAAKVEIVCPPMADLPPLPPQVPSGWYQDPKDPAKARYWTQGVRGGWGEKARRDVTARPVPSQEALLELVRVAQEAEAARMSRTACRVCGSPATLGAMCAACGQPIQSDADLVTPSAWKGYIGTPIATNRQLVAQLAAWLAEPVEAALVVSFGGGSGKAASAIGAMMAGALLPGSSIVEDVIIGTAAGRVSGRVNVPKSQGGRLTSRMALSIGGAGLVLLELGQGGLVPKGELWRCSYGQIARIEDVDMPLARRFRIRPVRGQPFDLDGQARSRDVAQHVQLMRRHVGGAAKQAPAQVPDPNTQSDEPLESVAPPEDALQQLERLARLRNDGALTEAEFQLARRPYVKRLTEGT